MDAEIKFGVAGSIRSEEAYALGKMLDHSGWGGQLVRRITPSDIDLALDNAGQIMFVELSRLNREWREISHGQRLLNQNFIHDRLHCAVLATHSIAPENGCKINTWTDIESFQVMIWHHGPIFSRVIEGTMWRSFARAWCNQLNGPLIIHRQIIAAHISRSQQQPTNVVPIRAP